MRVATVGLLLLTAASGCRGDAGTGPGETRQLTNLIISDVASAPATAAGAAVRMGQVYVSLPPGSVPGGVTALVQNRASDASREVVMVGGGFDPVPLPAADGDEIEVVVTDALGTPYVMRVPVPARRPPVVVRTSPPKGRTDVPLNSIIVVVFSEPMDPEVAEGDRVVLRSGLDRIAMTATLTPDGLTLELALPGLLEPGTRYLLTIARSAADLGGDLLGETYSTDFTTGTVAEEPEFAAVSAGRGFTCATTSAGAVYCWGRHPASGQPTSYRPAAVSASGLVQSLESGSTHACALRWDGRALCWGGQEAFPTDPADNPYGALPTVQGDNERFVEVAAGGFAHTCGIDATGRAYCWGMLRDTETSAVLSSGPLPVEPGPIYAAARTGDDFFCLLRLDGAVACGGRNERAQRGTGGFHRLDYWYDTSAEAAAAGGMIRVATVAAPGPFAQLAAGAAHACALDQGGSAFCWGDNVHGQLGARVTAECPAAPDVESCHSPLPVSAAGGLRFAEIDAGDGFTCGRTADGAVFCWGRNDTGQLGRGTMSTAEEPGVPVGGGMRFRSITTGHSHACGIVAADSHVYCWGFNRFGELGDGTTTPRSAPVQVAAPGG